MITIQITASHLILLVTRRRLYWQFLKYIRNIPCSFQVMNHLLSKYFTAGILKLWLVTQSLVATAFWGTVNFQHNEENLLSGLVLVLSESLCYSELQFWIMDITVWKLLLRQSLECWLVNGLFTSFLALIPYGVHYTLLSKATIRSLWTTFILFVCNSQWQARLCS